MRHLIATTLICCCFAFTTFAQSNYSVKGSVSDTISKAILDGATITIVNAKDSILQNFTYTSKGAFSIGNLKPGNYLLWISYADYADYSEAFKLDASTPTHDFGKLNLVSKAMLLNEVIIKSKAVAVKIKGDTTMFNAAAYFTQKNAKVDDLLKQLPGMRINQSGVIIFHGEEVKRLLVDGEEFYSDDPTLVSKTVRADMVANVLVYNDKSTEAKQTGVEDGVKVKTINLQLREDKRRGIFGKAEGGYGAGDYYVGKFNFNKFNPAEKISGFGNIYNNGGGAGAPKNRDGGLHYDGKWNKDKQSANADYKTGAVDNNIVGNTLTQNNQPGNYNRSVQNRNTHDYNSYQSGNVILNTKIDSTTTVSLSANGRDAYSEAQTRQYTDTYRANGVALNDNSNKTDGKNKNRSANTFLRVSKRLSKPGRSIGLSASGFFNESKSQDYVSSVLRLYNDQGIRFDSTIVDQYKPYINNSSNFSTSISFSEQLFKGFTVTAYYGLSAGNTNQSTLSYNKSAANVYNVFDPTFSSDFSTKRSGSSYSLYAFYRKDKLTAFINGSYSATNFKQIDRLIDTTLSRRFNNLYTSADFSYQLTKAAYISLSYNGNTSQPSIGQIQPLRQNTDQLNIEIGNPGLTPEFNNNFNLNYRVYRSSTDQGMNFKVNYSTRINAILRNRTTDTTSGINTYQWTNLKGKSPSSWRVYLEFYGRLTKQAFLLSPSLTVNGSTYYSYINNQLNTTKSTTYNPYISLSDGKPGYNYYVDMGVNYTVNSSSLQAVNNNTLGYFAHLNLFTKLPFNFYIGDEASYEFTAKNQVFADDFHRVLLKVYLGKNFLKEETLKVTLSGNDLFNQNTGYSRTGTQDNFVEERHNTIRRYFMLMVTWDFSKFGKSLQK
jgi:hypothetical protein